MIDADAPLATLDAVCTAMADLLDANRDQTEACLRYLHASRGHGNQVTFVHTGAAALMLEWDETRGTASATYCMGPPGADSLPRFAGRSLLLGSTTFDMLPETIVAAIAGRRLGEVATGADPFVAGIAHARIEDRIDHPGHIELVLDLEIADWR